MQMLDGCEGKSLKDEGMQRAADGAEGQHPGWCDMALEAFREYAKTHNQFTTEQVRTAMRQLPAPKELRAWGHVARRACKEAIVRKVGMVQAQSPTVHCMYVSLYESQVFSGKAA